jgi:hypothetical protein
MIRSPDPDPTDHGTATPPSGRRARVILLGEFSAGKSTLANALLGRQASPMRVTATQVPPLWYVFGPAEAPPVAIGAEGDETPLPQGDLAAAPPGTRFLRVPCPAPILERIDLMDMPGSSDPNMDPAIWDALLPEADAAVWCTAATQAWRQSEAALWEAMPPQLQARGLLLVTRIDKVEAQRDRERVIARVRRETAGAFRAVLPVSLTEALAAEADPEASAAAGFCEARRAILALASDDTGTDPGATDRADATAAGGDVVPLARIAGRDGRHDEGPEEAPASPAAPAAAVQAVPAAPVTPRRITPARRSRAASEGSLL